MSEQKKPLQDKKTVSPDLVKYSRAGDTFHYRWAARRCLRLLDLNTTLNQIIIEGSKEPKLGGEYVIDTAEYSTDEISRESVEYFQLKHSTAQLDKDFTLSSLKDTIVGFANRYRHLDKSQHNFFSIKFTVVTNRPISIHFKESVKKLASGKPGGTQFDRTIKAYTKLKGKKLSAFCRCLQLSDGEGDYDGQKHELHRELVKLTCETSDTSPLLSLVDLIRTRIEPKSTRKDIKKDDVLEQFGLTSEKELFPAPPLFEELSSPIVRKQYDRLFQLIVEPHASFMIFKAVGGTGKSITCHQLVDRLGNGSMAIAYDCFGNGGYRKLSEHRHRVCDAYVQVANQLAQKGLCEAMIPVKRDQDDKITQGFLLRLSQAVEKLRETNQDALLIILFDAVDNAEMAAKEFGDRCFARYLLRETLPDGCRVVFLSRPERVHLFNPPDSIPQVEIEPFNNEESLQYLQLRYPDACLQDAIEFRRLTDGNPRVQANVLALEKLSIGEVLAYLGPSGKTVDDLIEEQLQKAIATVKNAYPQGFEQHIDDICTGLATLPPFIPLEVLAAVSGTEVSAVKSFIADLGRPLWLTDNYVQFRDEPTETWFTKNYAATEEQIKSYIHRLESLADTYSYVSEALPSLLLKSGQYDALIALALSEDMLPSDNPVDARNIQVYRLQFAFKAALKNKRYADACKLALRAGEEVAGSERQMEILSKNIDLATHFLSEQRIMELAHHRVMHGQWNGSETLYSAALLSSIPECEGEARSYLRSGYHWLRRYIEERDNEGEDEHGNDKLEDSDVLAMLFCYYKLDGEVVAIDFIKKWRPDELIYRVMRVFSERLVDASEFSALNKMALYGKDHPAIVIAINQELFKIGLTLDKKILTQTLNKIVSPKSWLEKPNDIFDKHPHTVSSPLSYFDACIINKLSTTNIRRALNHYIDEPRLHTIDNDWHSENRSNYLRSIAIRACINSKYDCSVVDIVPKSWKKEAPSHHDKKELKDVTTIIEALLPWYMIRAKLLAGKRISIDKWHKQAQKVTSQKLSSRYQQYDPLPFEITNARFFNLVLAKDNLDSELDNLIEEIQSSKIKFRHPDQLHALRIANRNNRLKPIADSLETSCYQILQIVDEEGPMENANGFISLSRAVLASSKADAEVYFENAIEVVSRFGDEAVERWEAIVSIAKYCSLGGNMGPAEAYRFMRCAELIGNTVPREKHWDRDEAMATCFHLSPTSAFTIASRWNDREVGRSGRMLAALLTAALNAKTITPSLAWSISALPFDYELVDFASQCIANETDPKNQQIIFNDLVIGYRKRGTVGDVWLAIDRLAKEHGLHHRELDHLKLLISKEKEAIPELRAPFFKENTKDNYEELYGDINFPSDEGLRQALNRFESLEAPRDYQGLWRYVTSKISNANAIKYLSLIANAEYLDLHDIRTAIRHFPDTLRKKPGIQKAWPNIVKIIAERYPDDFIRCYHREWVLKDFGNDDITRNAVKEGVLRSLSESNGLESASTFYGFAGYCVVEIPLAEAEALLDFALTRFELHIDESEFADGPWRTELLPPMHISASITGYIWSCLGSPESSQRWCAAHVVRRMYELGCEQEIDELITWMANGHAEGFISRNHPFYNLHAQLYLLVSFARCAANDTHLLTKHSKTFCDIALKGEAHILVQKYAADIALAIAQSIPTAYELDIVGQLKQVGKSPFPVQIAEGYYAIHDTPWHDQGTVDLSLDLSFSHDFDRFWFGTLGDVFKVPSKQVEELAAEVVLKDWGLSFRERFIRDPRQEFWNNRRDRSTWHSNSDYPKTDDYSFYLSYHSMMKVAARLLKTMPVIYSPEWDENNWQEWLDGHLLTREDGYWLADRRDYIPISSRQWLNDKVDNDWRWQIMPKDFLEVLLFEQQEETWLNIAGSWNKYRNGHNESIDISSKLVPRFASRALQRAIIYHQSNKTDIKSLAHFDERIYDDTTEHSFKLHNWYNEEYPQTRIDEFDPYSAALDYPPITLNHDVAEKLKLKPDKENRYWFNVDSDQVMLCSQLWSEDKPQREDNEYYSKGKRLQASLTLLKNLLSAFDMDLVIEVDIHRQLTYRNKDDEFGYTSPYRKIYILSKDGRLKDTRKSFMLREKVRAKSKKT